MILRIIVGTLCGEIVIGAGIAGIAEGDFDDIVAGEIILHGLIALVAAIAIVTEGFLFAFTGHWVNV